MKNVRFIVLLFAFLLAAGLVWSEGKFGVGVIAGQPSGLSVNYLLGSRVSVDGAFAWSFIDNGSLYVHGDMQYRIFEIVNIDPGNLIFVSGIGARLLFLSNINLGLRIPVGLSFNFRRVPIELFLEIAPTLELIPATKFSAGAAVGVRYYF